MLHVRGKSPRGGQGGNVIAGASHAASPKIHDPIDFRLKVASAWRRARIQCSVTRLMLAAFLFWHLVAAAVGIGGIHPSTGGANIDSGLLHAASSRFVSQQDEQQSSHVNTTKVLFVVSASEANQKNILSQYASYNPNQVHLWLNVYDKNETDSDSTKTQRGRGGPSKGIIRTFIPGIKTTLWPHLTRDAVAEYDYIWSLDDDMLFDKNLFSFDQFLWLVKETDAIVSSPKIVRVLKQTDEKLIARQAEVGRKMPPRGLFTEESVGDKMAAKVWNLELGTVMFKREAWLFLMEEVFIPNDSTDCGLDCVWCHVFKARPEFGKVPCLRTYHVGLIHQNTLSMQRWRMGNCGYALKAYKNKVAKAFGIRPGGGPCNDKRLEFISIEDLGYRATK